MFGQILANGLMLGGLYAAIGVSFSLIYGITGIVNLAHGTQIVMGAYVTFVLSKALKIDPFLTIPATFVCLFIVGQLIQKYVVNMVIKSGLMMTSLLTFGINLFLVNILILLFTIDLRGLQPAYAGMNFEIFGITVPYIRVFIFIVAIAMTLLLELFLAKTKTGNSIRATVFNKKAAQLMGIHLGRTYTTTFAIASAMAGITGTLIITYSAVSPFSGGDFLMILFTVAVLGGLGSIPGALVGGLVLGLFESFTVLILGVEFTKIVSFTVFMLILIIRPVGIMGKQFYE